MPIDLLPGAKADLNELRRSDPDALAIIAVFLQEAGAETHNELVDKSTTHGNSTIGTNLVNVKAWISQRYRSNNLLRFQILDTPASGYRIVYGYDWHTRHIGILAVVKRNSFNYEISGDLADRIENDWRTATGGLPT